MQRVELEVLDWVLVCEVLPPLIRIGHPRDEVFYQLMSLEPVVYKGTRSASNTDPPARDDECLWLFQRGPMWVAAHAPKNATEVHEVINTTHLVFATDENALEEGDHNWDSVDMSGLLPNGDVPLVSLGSFRTQHVDEPDSMQLP
jgi:hypothetical protein